MMTLIENFKKYWFLFVLSFIAFLLLFFWIKLRTTSKIQEVITSPSPILPTLPKIVFPDIGKPIAISEDKIKFNLKNNIEETLLSLPRISAITITPSQASLIALQLGFPSNPSQVVKGASGESQVWFKDASSLIIKTSPLKIKLITEEFFSKFPTTGNFLPPQEYEDYIKKFLLNIIPQQNNIRYVLDEAVEARAGKTIKVSLSPVFQGKRIVDSSAESLVIAEFQKDKKLFSFSFNFGATILDQNLGSYPAKTKSEIEKTILSEGRVISLGEPQESPPDLVYSTITIDSFENALFFLPEKPDMLYPIYILEGTASTQEGDLHIIIYLPAVKSVYVSFTP
jgi:hypothetical protein